MDSRLPSTLEARASIERWYAAGLKAVDPGNAVRRTISWNGAALGVDSIAIDLRPTARLTAIAFGKAASEMAAGLSGIVGDRVAKGIILTRDDHANDPPAGWDVFEASHPVPDGRGVQATRKIVEALDGLGSDDIAVVLVSGGGSALLEAPRDPLTLEDIQETTRLLLNAGAPIQHLNAVRSELSQVKGGGLRRVIGDATCVSLILSDVLGNDPSVIASGPTIARRRDPKTALALLAAYDLTDRTPPAVMAMLRNTGDPPEPPDITKDRFVVVGDNEMFLDSISEAVARDGSPQRIALRAAEGEARDLALKFIEMAVAESSETETLIGGGEATVTVRGPGVGGRNTEFALAAAIALDERELDWSIASLASDGQDGTVDAAGAIVDRHSVSRGRDIGLDAWQFLDNNDSGEFFRQLGQLVAPGPTGTNVNDVYVAVRTNHGSPASSV